jgi:hypothetical protein
MYKHERLLVGAKEFYDDIIRNFMQKKEEAAVDYKLVFLNNYYL